MNFDEAQEAARKRGLHPTRLAHVAWEINPLELKYYPRPPTPLDSMVVSLRLAGLPADKVAAATGKTKPEILSILNLWGSEYLGTFAVLPEYIPGLGLADYLPAESPDLKALQREIVAEAEKAAAKECARRGLPIPRNRRVRRKRL